MFSTHYLMHNHKFLWPTTRKDQPELHHSMEHILSIAHQSSEVRQGGCCPPPSASVLNQLLRSHVSFSENRDRVRWFKE